MCALVTGVPACALPIFEVLRGPQSAIWGSDAIGGVVNIVTRRGRPGLRGHASAEGGSFGTYRLNGGVSGGAERVRGSISGSLLETDGIDVSGTGGEKDGYRNATVNATADFDLTEALTRSEEHTSELQSLMRSSYAAFCLKKTQYTS